jgi:hypothetical protein
MFDSRVLRSLFRTKRDEMTGKWRKLRNEEFHNFHSSLGVIRMFRSRRKR